MNNIYQEIAVMREGMRLIGYSKEDIQNATEDVTSANNYEDALRRVKKYWK